MNTKPRLNKSYYSQQPTQPLERESFSRHALKTLGGIIDKNSPKKPVKLNQIGAKFRDDLNNSTDAFSRNPYQQNMRNASTDANITSTDAS
jgi:hypothetical protein